MTILLVANWLNLMIVSNAITTMIEIVRYFLSVFKEVVG